MVSANRSKLLYELATILRLQARFDEAVATYRAAIDADGADGEVAFDAWIGIARAHVYGDKNHGAAADAFQHAVEAAGAQPTPKQRYDMAGYLGQLQAERGENEAALVNTLEALRLAATEADQFYAQLDAGSILRNFAESCDYRPLVDTKTKDDPRDGWGVPPGRRLRCRVLHTGECDGGTAGVGLSATASRPKLQRARVAAVHDQQSGRDGRARRRSRIRCRGRHRRSRE